MSSTIERPEFLPPPEPGLLRSIGLAVLAHVVLVLALSWGLRWKQDDNRVSVEAEIWSASVQQAAPKPVEAPPPPPPPPPQPKQEQPVVKETPPPPTPDRDAEIALERKRQAEEKARQEEAERQRQIAERKRQEEAERKRELAERQRQEEQKKQELARKAAEEKKREEQAQAKRKLEEEQRLAKLREENLKRIQGLAGATGAPTSTGVATRASGPSEGYAGRIRARVRPNIVFADDAPGNPSAEVLVRLAPDGTIIGKQIRKSSGLKSWDDAVLRALDRTEILPRDVDGSVPSAMVLVFKPRE